MTTDKIKEMIAKIDAIKTELKGIKADIKIEEKIDTPEFLDLEKAFKDLKKQIKDYKDEWLNELKGDAHYDKLRSMKIQAEEKLAEAKNELFDEIKKLPADKATELFADTEAGPVRIQVMPEMRLYLNGREEKAGI